jgi:hypothetical protein
MVDEAADPFAAPYLHPRPRSASPPPSPPAAASVNQPTPSQPVPNLPDPAPTPTPTPNRLPSSPNPDPRLPWQYNLRTARTNAVVPAAPPLVDSPILSHLSPKTSVTTKRPRHDAPPHEAPVSREAVAERGGAIPPAQKADAKMTVTHYTTET